MGNRPVSRLEMADARPDLKNLHRGLMPEEVGKVAVRPLDRIDLADLGTTNPCDQNFYQRLPMGKGGHFDFVDHQVAAGSDKNGGDGLQSFPAATRPFMVRILYHSSRSFSWPARKASITSRIPSSTPNFGVKPVAKSFLEDKR